MHKNTWILLGVWSCLIVCAGDFIVTFFLGIFYPGYNSLKQSMSVLGTSQSPVAYGMVLWGFVFSMLFILFATGFRKAFPSDNRAIQIVYWLIILYGLGEGVGSGLFPYDKVGTTLSTSAVLHSLFDAIATVALMAIPFVMLYFFNQQNFLKLHTISIIVTSIGLIMIVLFSFSKLDAVQGTLFANRGLWQRLFLFDYYVYLGTLSFFMKPVAGE